jgi:hypothetical protein
VLKIDKCEKEGAIRTDVRESREVNQPGATQPQKKKHVGVGGHMTAGPMASPLSKRHLDKM